MFVITGKWESLQGAVATARALGDEVANREILEKALVEEGRPLRDDISRTAPRSPVAPHVAETFVVRPARSAREERQALVRVGPKAGKGSVGFVASFLEFGTYKMAPQPFIRPAYDGWKGGFPKRMAARIRHHYDRVIRKYTRKGKK